MAEEKKVYEKVTLKGTAVYPKLTEPYKYKESEQRSVVDPTGEYTVDMDFEPEEVQELLNKIDTLVEMKTKEMEELVEEKYQKDLTKVPEAKKNTVKKESFKVGLPYKWLETGKVRLKFKQKGQYTNKKQEVVNTKIRFVNAAAKPMFPDSVWSGTLMRINATILDYGNLGIGRAGVSLGINEIQILKLVSGQQSCFEPDEEYLAESQEIIDELAIEPEFDPESELIGEDEIPF
jgi:hypothetical protein